jgi:hypothetical protein
MDEPVSVTVHVDAPPDVVYRLVSDLPRMGEWSPENTGGRWLGGATPSTPGARFKGTNTNGSRSWSTTAKVTEATPGEAFVFDVVVGPIRIARWSYRITPASGGCDVTESWHDQRGGLAKRLGGRVSGVDDRATFAEASMRTTLERLKAAAEG